MYQNSAGSDGELFTSVCLSDGLSNIVIMGELGHLFSVMGVIQSIAYIQMTPFPPLSFIIHNSTNYLRLTYLLILSALFKLAARLYHYLPLTQQITGTTVTMQKANITLLG